jgi:hypothetical protein
MATADAARTVLSDFAERLLHGVSDDRLQLRVVLIGRHSDGPDSLGFAIDAVSAECRPACTRQGENLNHGANGLVCR